MNALLVVTAGVVAYLMTSLISAEQTCEPSESCPKPEQCRNVALKSSVKTSSAMFGGKPEMIVDGHASTTFGENGHCLHFLPEVQPWIRIDLGESFLVYSVNVTTRDDGYNWDDRDKDLEIRIGEHADNFTQNSLCTKLEGTVGVQKHMCCNQAIRGRYVWLRRHSKEKKYMHVCEVQVLECTARCSLHGQGHVHSFNKRWTSYEGSCPVVMARDNCQGGFPCEEEEPTFNIISKSVANEDGRRERQIDVTFRSLGNVLIEFKQGEQVALINGAPIPEFPFLPYAGLTISKTNTLVYIVYEPAGLMVKWDGHGGLDITMASHQANHVCGLCGSFRQGGDAVLGPSAECTNHTRAPRPDDPVAFALSWLHAADLSIDGACAEECHHQDVLVTDPCGNDTEAADTCAILSDTEGPFRRCIVEMNATEIEQIRENCRRDFCRIGRLALCAHAQAFASRCRDDHLMRLQWRSALKCPMNCPGHLLYEPFAPPCAATCLQLPGSACAAPDVWVEDCVCSEGKVSHKDKCVKPEDCGCDDPELGFIKVNKAMIKGECQERCSCMEDTLEVRCVGFTCPPDTFCALADDTLRTCAAMNCLSHPKDEACGGAAAPKWYFVPSEGRCQQFSSTGCAGVDNVFNTWSECLWKCLAPRTAGLRRCHQPREAGSCSENEQRFYFDWGQGRCMNFSYSGCDGNDNNFVREQDCENNCYPFIIPDSCYQPPKSGSCDNPTETTAWFYDQASGMCRTFSRKDCGGEHHGNSFSSQTMCRNTCAPWQNAVIGDICSLPADPGPCAGGKVRLRRWYFDAVRGKCRTFKYGGCEGNENKFISQAECEQRCDKQEGR